MAKKLSKADLERINALKTPHGTTNGDAGGASKEKFAGASQGKKASQNQHRSQSK